MNPAEVRASSICNQSSQPIAGANSAQFTPGDAEVDGVLSINYQYVDAGGSNETVEVKKLYKDASSSRLGVVIWRFFNDTPSASGGGMEGMGRRIVT